MTKTPRLRTDIEQNRRTINELLFGAGSYKRLNNINWLRHEIAYVEPKTLFYVPNREQTRLYISSSTCNGAKIS